MVSIPACHAGDRGSIPRRGAMLLLGSLWLSNQWSLSKSDVNQMIINDPTKSNESKAQQVPLNSFLYQIFE